MEHRSPEKSPETIVLFLALYLISKRLHTTLSLCNKTIKGHRALEHAGLLGVMLGEEKGAKGCCPSKKDSNLPLVSAVQELFCIDVEKACTQGSICQDQKT